jgi:hypothetical protein
MTSGWQRRSISRAAALATLAGLGCGGGSSLPLPDQHDGSYLGSPIASSDSTGTYMFTVSAARPLLVNQNASTRFAWSPNKTLFAQTRADGVTDVHDLGFVLEGSFESSLLLVGWAGEGRLVFQNQNVVGDVVNVRKDGSDRWSFDFGLTAETGYPDIWRLALSHDGRYLAVSFLLFLDVLVADTQTGAVVGRFPLDDRVYPASLTWLRDGTLVAWSDGSPLFATTTVASGVFTVTPSPVAPCTLESWTPAHPILLGGYVTSGDTASCVRRIAVRKDGSGATPLDWLTDPAIPGAAAATAVYAVSRDAARVVYRFSGAINIASPDGSGASVLVPDRQADALAW